MITYYIIYTNQVEKYNYYYISEPFYSQERSIRVQFDNSKN